MHVKWVQIRFLANAKRLLCTAVMVAPLLATALAIAAQIDPGGNVDATAVLRSARTVAARGNAEGALVQLEHYFEDGQSKLGQPDLAVFRLEAARIAAKAGKPDRARKHIEAAQAIADGPDFRPEPLLAAYLRRDLAAVREQIGDLDQAEQLLSVALQEFEGADLRAAADAANARGSVRLELLRIREAIADFELSLSILRRTWREQGQDQQRLDPKGERAVAALCNLATARAALGDSEGVHIAAARARIAAGDNSRLNRAADLAEAQARLRALDTTGADALLNKVASQGAPDDPLRGHAHLALATALFERGRMSEAAQAAALAIKDYRAALGEQHPAFARAQHTLGTAQTELGDTGRAQDALHRASTIWRATTGINSVPFNATEIEIGVLSFRGGDFDDAERKAKAALAAYAAAPPPDQRPEGLATVLLGLVAEARGRTNDAALLFRRAQTLIEQARGPYSPDLGFSLVRLGRMLTRVQSYTNAAPPIDRAIAIYERVGGAGTVRLGEALTARAELRVRAGDRHGALEDARHALALLHNRVGGVEFAGDTGAGTLRRSVRELFIAQARLLLELAPEDPVVVGEAFAASQEALTSRAGEALRLTTARLVAQGGDLALLLRDRDNAIDAMLQADTLMLDWAAQPGADPREGGRLAAARQAAAYNLDSKNKAIAESFPGHAEFLSPRPATLADVQHSLDDDEAMLAPVVSDDGMLLWVLTHDELRPVTLPTRSATLADLVNHVRKGVDLDAVQGKIGQLAPFDVDAARALHAALIVPAEKTGLLRSARQLVLVPDGSLQSLPPHLLIDEHQNWVVVRYAIAVAPSVAAAVAARTAAERPSQAQLGFLGVGDPLFAEYTAAEQDSVGDLSFELRQKLARLVPLPATRTELQTIADQYGAGERHVLFQEDATVDKFMDAQPQRFRTIAFSTHALMAGDFSGLPEPSIILTPENGKGLLTASAIAVLELDADLVLLSACNTGAGDGGPYAEGLSGLARAFLHAGARSLLVSHWSVASESTVELVTSFVAAERAASGQRRAKALQTAMLAMIGDGNQPYSHPVFWAPFVIVGR